MTDDAELLRQYKEYGSEDAFSELVRRHLPVVYSAALRQVAGDRSLAKDVAQTVFIDLARKAVSLSSREFLAGWLYTSTRFAAAKAVRAERRRHNRERIAASMHEHLVPTHQEAACAEIGPALDDAMAELSSEDRNAVLLRFFQRKDLKCVGAALGVSEDAARMRVNRALEKLHTNLIGRGVSLSVATLAAALSWQAVITVPAGLSASIAASAFASGASASWIAVFFRLFFASRWSSGLFVAGIGLLSVFVILFPSPIKPPQPFPPRADTQPARTKTVSASPLAPRAQERAPLDSQANAPAIETRAVVARTARTAPALSTQPNTPALLTAPLGDLTVMAAPAPRKEPFPIELVWIGPGSFTLGSPPSEIGRTMVEGPQTRVTISQGFWLGKHEVTVAQYKSLVRAGPRTGSGMFNSLNGSDPEKPVAGVSWAQATNFCFRLTEQERKAGRLPHGYIYRLPTEAEWEYACRAGKTSRFSFGDDPRYRALASNAWYRANSDKTTHVVGTRLPNGWGLCDMQGNLSEWCLDWLETYPGDEIINPVGTLFGRYHVLRGGNWESPPDRCRCASRHWCIASEGIIDAGFRVALAANLDAQFFTTISDGTTPEGSQTEMELNGRQ